MIARPAQPLFEIHFPVDFLHHQALDHTWIRAIGCRAFRIGTERRFGKIAWTGVVFNIREGCRR